eukprot:m.83484 g.83484  ORF g.83484 m.83484 type:complete len:61 (-) comp21125_c0_seq1:797-979(-)
MCPFGSTNFPKFFHLDGWVGYVFCVFVWCVSKCVRVSSSSLFLTCAPVLMFLVIHLHDFR